MNLLNLFLSRYRLSLLGAGLAVLVLAGTPSYAAPGAHGPNGEHLDAPAQAGTNSGPVPSFEARSEAFELVGRLQGGELSILINRFATNEPVLNATVEVETSNLKAPAKFHADMGDYAIDDANMLKVLAGPGDHPIVITVLAGNDSDLLDGTLTVAGAALDDHGHSHDDGHAHGLSRTVWLALALVVLAAVGWFFGCTPKAAGTPSKGGAL
ncbi:hypothetical protein [Acidovorax sp. Root70]|uniref:hypothetical protein n=1 Tax=Acidovorax sp. Root70 TaxID=1736590 RepID=UPI0006F91140|nr:hypothetical protein [Acidovorax sp. Root70]KRB31271.1 hypothetical protein ASD94_22730 [Acidovorax sp. Root70]